ncbi:PLP-dependent aminotransferase family protein [Telmatobacter bradus]|jgi:GntR family transcriptional regulator/MocR family aminotransferase|uniref:MocR-like pyridoxine biosynthesis transcription factor PdxR n=1 Tax=Telmatobacter bradus TaxID=474953 RepID=UPI003B43C289
MAKVESFQELVIGPGDGKLERWRWLYAELRSAILEGRLRSGSRVPSSRSLSVQHGVARGTVVTALNQLKAEGYVVTESGSGTRVALELPNGSAGTKRPRVALETPSRASLSRRTRQALKGAYLLPVGHSVGKAFRSYEPAIDLFPVELWARISSRVLRHAPRALYGQGSACGYMPLRKAISEYVGASRGVRCTPEQVIITSGAQQGLDLVARFLLDPEDEVWMEDPGYPGALQAFRAASAVPVPVPIDGEGICVDKGVQLSPRARMAYVTPANQFPLGVTMSVSRRVELLNWAAKAHAWIIEDEYDAEYRYCGRPVAALQSLDHSGCVVYVGTFTKMLFNALRLGFLVVPERLIHPFEVGRSYIDRHPPTLDQAILAEFISEGHFGHHVRRMRQTYAERMEVLMQASKEHLGGMLNVTEAVAGMRSVAWLTRRGSDMDAAKGATQRGLEVAALSVFTVKHRQNPALILGFAGSSKNEIRRGVVTLAAALRDLH